MQVLNAAIRVTHSNEDDSRERSMKEVFTQFNEQLFWTTQQQDYHSIINLLGEEAAVKQETPNICNKDKDKAKNEEKKKEKKKDKDKDKDSLSGSDIVDFFDLTL
jgi:hypothetical protein